MAVITANMRATIALQCEREDEYKRPAWVYRAIRTGMDGAFRCAGITARLPATRVLATGCAGDWGIEP